MNAIPVIRLGKVSKRKIVIEVVTSSVASVSVRSVSRRALLNSVSRHARKIRMNWMERYPLRGPPSAITLHTPTWNV